MLPLSTRLYRMAWCMKHRIEMSTHPWGRNSTRWLTELKDAQRGKRCFIIGNGPSLRRTDLTKLRDEYTFGMNRIYILFPELGFHTTYFVSINHLVVKQCAQDILSLPMPKFLPWYSRRDLGKATPDTIFLNVVCGLDRPGFTTDMRKTFWHGATVTYVAMQLAYHMGFEQVILVGVDHSFVEKGPAGQTVISHGNDPNHFDPNYFGKGFAWQLPDLENSEKAYRFAKEGFEKDRRQILDATVDGKLTIFPKVDYSSLF